MVLCFIPFLGWSQQKVRALEFEIGGGYSLATGLGKHLNAAQLFLELRRGNLPRSRFDIGIQLCLTGTTNENCMI